MTAVLIHERWAIVRCSFPCDLAIPVKPQRTRSVKRGRDLELVERESQLLNASGSV